MEVIQNDISAVSARPDYDEKIIALINSTTSPKVLNDELSDFHTNDIAQAFTMLSKPERERLYKMLDTRLLEEIFSYFDEEEQAQFLGELNVKKAIAILNNMDAGDAAELLRGVNKNRRDILIELLDDDARAQISMIFSYDEDEIGSKMSTGYIQIHRGLSVKEAMRELLKQAKENEEITLLYVIDENGQYYGAINIRDLFKARANTDLETIIETNFPFVYAHEMIDDLIEDLKDYSENSIPVLDNDNKILGVITHKDLVEVFNDEMEEDYAKLAGLSAKEDLEEPLYKSMAKRLPWLCVLLVLALGVSSVISMFEGVVAKLAIIVAFQSLILDMAGNVGTQSLAVSIRVLMDDELSFKQKMYLIFKEVRVGFVNGLILGVSSALILGLYIHFSHHMGWAVAYSISSCIGIAMLVSMVISSFTGTAIPTLFKSLGVDPAVASGPLITTLNDLIGAVTYYSLTWIFLIHVLHL